jgi:AhpD family alkylhydroperoxidase
MEDPAKERSRYYRISPVAGRAFSAMDEYIKTCGLEAELVELVRLRASMINGCAYCLQMHSHDALERGERIERLFQLGGWAESPVFSARERAALGWTDAVTLVHSSRVPEAVYEQARSQFSEKELVDLTWAIVTINGWNRMSISFRGQPEIPPPPPEGKGKH